VSRLTLPTWSRCIGAVCAIAVSAVAPTADAARGPLRADDASWVAGGRLIAFGGYYGRDWDNARLWVMNADGTGRRQLTAAGVLSPSGRMVANSWDTGSAGIVFIGRLKGKAIKSFTIRVPGAEGYGPLVWAPDERAVAVWVLAARAMIFVADVRTGLRLVSRDRSRDDESPAWSPDGRRIAFVTCATDTSNCHLAVMDRTGRHRRAIVRNIDAIGYSVQPVWAPNGRAIAFATRFGPTRPSRTDPAPQRYAIYTVRPDGSELKRVASTPYMESLGVSLDWSADSRQIAFVDNRGISTVEVSTGRQRLLTSKGSNSGVSWAPSRRILFVDRGRIYTQTPGQRPRRVLP
jgi:hypothetical protein